MLEFRLMILGTARLGRALSKPILLVTGVLLFAGCQRESTIVQLHDIVSTDTTAARSQEFNPRLMRRFASIHRVIEWQDLKRIKLGRILYFEPLLSVNGRLSCNSCHPLDRYGTTAQRFDRGVDGQRVRRNTPSVYNVAGQFRQFWDGAARTLDEQALQHLINPAILGTTSERLEQALRAVPGYRAAFRDAFPAQAEPVTVANVAAALSVFERGLITPSRWDRYLDGDPAALTDSEQAGARLFANIGCLECHTGAFVGGAMFAKVGRVTPWPNQTDHGRYEITRDLADDMMFKVPSLRNVARTGPYFHDGSAASLQAAVRAMAVHQLGMYPSDAQVQSIVEWLSSMTGDLPEDYIEPPTLPPATRPPQEQRP